MLHESEEKSQSYEQTQNELLDQIEKLTIQVESLNESKKSFDDVSTLKQENEKVVKNLQEVEKKVKELQDQNLKLTHENRLAIGKKISLNFLIFF